MINFIAEPSAEVAEPGAGLMAEKARPPNRASTRGFGNAIRPDMGSAHLYLFVPLCYSDSFHRRRDPDMCKEPCAHAIWPDHAGWLITDSTPPFRMYMFLPSYRLSQVANQKRPRCKWRSRSAQTTAHAVEMVIRC
jgi:hypothetical protein